MATMLNTILLEPVFYDNNSDTNIDSKEFLLPMEPLMNFDPHEFPTLEDLHFPIDFAENGQNWSSKPPDQWSPQEVCEWIRTWTIHNGVADIEVAHLLYNQMPGFELIQLRKDYFTSLCPQYGHLIFDALQLLVQQFQPQDQFSFSDLLTTNCCLDLDHQQRCHSLSSESTSSNLSDEIKFQEIPEIPTPVQPVKKSGRRGRPPKKDAKSRSKGNGKLWEFIRDLLLNPITNPSFIRWERREDGVFKFVQSDKVAKMWGERKQNPRMTYEKLSRAMRYYYKSQVLLPVFGRRLVYKFGPNATGWRPQYDHILLQK